METKQPYDPEKNKIDAEVGSYWKNSPEYIQMQKNLAQVQGLQSQFNGLQQEHPGFTPVTPDQFELQAGVTPPGYEGTRDQQGNLLSQYKLDPYSGEAEQALKKQAFAQGPSEQAQQLLQQQQMQQQQQMGNASQQQMSARDQAQSQLARSGGLTGGAAALLARQGARDSLNTQQGISGQGAQQRLGILSQDTANKNSLLGAFGDKEMQAAQGNIGTAQQDITNHALFNTNRYNQQMQAWGAQQSADATRAAGGAGGKK